ncbi:cell envelope integrity protein TolA [Psychrobacter nivimaris]|uniref:cell envelope integrity protein TolA n=1 Tax=Psychrobacter nivimaris TaxID=281738 RepID=UPI00191B5FC3|nr:cell envelope integrity protein TolA [Psychrobacter nivimaris]
MEDTMSSYSFSHQFYQRWTCAPEPVRAAITQELKDITTLLQPDTSFEDFTFNTHDLDAHVDELYDNYNAEQAIAKAITDKQEKEDAAAAKQKLEDEQKKKETEEATFKAEATRKEQEKNEQSALKTDNDKELAATDVANSNTDKVVADITVTDDFVTENSNAKIEKVASEVVNTESNASDNKNADNRNIGEQAHTLSDNHIKDINNKASAAINLALKDAKLDATHQQLIRELETQVDDYLSEQMMLMSENLKSWLRAEVTQHFSEQNDSTTNNEAAKKIIH